jgi:hypothetical protein
LSSPTSLDELLIQPWPAAWGYALFVIVFVGGCRFWRWGRPTPLWLGLIPLLWLCWQFLSATTTVDRALTASTLPHFVTCVGAFYLGLFALAKVERLSLFWLGLLGGFMVVLVMGWRQHFGGLEETRRFFHSLPDWQSYPPEFLKKVSSDRIYSTLFYPNALAGVVLLLLPATMAIVWQTVRASLSLKVILAVIIATLGLGALYWSGSKSGWLIVMVQVSIALWRWPLRDRVRPVAIAGIVMLGLGVFAFEYRDYFGRGATSVTARFDYWRAASQTLAGKPLLGSGPGTFMFAYRQLKAPEAEMTRLAHNDYLQQGSDSGWCGLLAYAAWLWGGILILYRKARSNLMGFCVWLGLTGMALQSFVEFGLYIPALAWPFFILLGWSHGGGVGSAGASLPTGVTGVVRQRIGSTRFPSPTRFAGRYEDSFSKRPKPQLVGQARARDLWFADVDRH